MQLNCSFSVPAIATRTGSAKPPLQKKLFGALKDRANGIRDGAAGPHRGVARDVHARLGFGHAAAQDHILDRAGLDAGALDG